MSDLVPWSRGQAVQRAEQRSYNVIHAQTGKQLTKSRAMSTAGKQAMFDALDLKNTQRELEHINQDAAELLNLIANSIGMEILSSARRFCFELGD